MAKKRVAKKKSTAKEKIGKKNAPTIVDAYLSQFVENNPHAVIDVDGDILKIKKLWGLDDTSIVFKIDDHGFFADLNNLTINPKYDAIIHNDSNTLEVFWTYAKKDEKTTPLLDRSFKFHFEDYECLCKYSEPTESCWQIALRSERLPGILFDGTVPQLEMFKVAKSEKISKRGKEFFEKRIPRNFFIIPSKPLAEINLEKLIRHLNFIMDYYDRETPEVDIRLDEVDSQIKNRESLRFIEGEFPPELVVTEMDEIVLQLLEVARNSPPRHGFVYYYQVLEYINHYYVDDKIKKELRLQLRDPTIVNCTDRKLGEMFSLLTDRHRDDRQKMMQMISECVDSQLVWKEIENERSFFSKQHTFDGEFVLEAIISEKQNYESWKQNGFNTLFEQLKAVRNCLVHAREKRENKVILPTTANNARIRYLVPIIQRIASQVTINS